MTTTEARLRSAYIAETIRDQIGMETMMSAGAHNLVALDETEQRRGGLTFKVGGAKLTWIEVELTHLDVYTVTRVRVRKGVRVEDPQYEMIYAGQLSALIYKMVNQ